MEITLQQLLGLYFVIVGAIVLYRRKSMMPAIAQIAANRPLLLVIALIELMAGLAVVLTNPNVTPDASGLVSLIGWMLIVEAVIYMAMPYRNVQRMIRSFNTPQWYSVGGVIAVLAGLYLAANGFGWVM